MEYVLYYGSLSCLLTLTSSGGQEAIIVPGPAFPSSF